MGMNNFCPVCGYDLGFPAWDDDSPSDEICPSCGIQFGYDDSKDGEFRKGQYFGWRKKWIQNGCIWSSKNPQPKGWNPKKQLENIPENFK
jgi:hypothetical protein